MATQSTEYRSCTRLNCGVSLPTPVILCVPPEIVVQPVEGVTFSTIEATMETEVCTQGSGCASTYWTYTFTYDDAQLIEGAVLTGDGITGVICDNCFTQWVREYYCPLSVQDTFSVDLTIDSEHCQTLTADVNISEDEGNQLTEETDGLYSAPLLVEDTATVDLTIDTATGQTLSADVKISADADNVVEARADGLYVATADIQAGMANLYLNSTPVVNTGTSEETLHSFSLPALSLATVNDRLEIRMEGGFNNNTGNKRLRMYFGSDLVFDTGGNPFDNLAWKLSVTIVRVTVLSQRGYIDFRTYEAGGVVPLAGAAAFEGAVILQDLAAPVLIRATSEADSALDIIQSLTIVDRILG